jgi:hypothetical protein
MLVTAVVKKQKNSTKHKDGQKRKYYNQKKEKNSCLFLPFSLTEISPAFDHAQKRVLRKQE